MPDLEKIPHVGDGAIDTAVYVQSKEIMLAWHLNCECLTIHVI